MKIFLSIVALIGGYLVLSFFVSLLTGKSIKVGMGDEDGDGEE